MTPLVVEAARVPSRHQPRSPQPNNRYFKNKRQLSNSPSLPPTVTSTPTESFSSEAQLSETATSVEFIIPTDYIHQPLKPMWHRNSDRYGCFKCDPISGMNQCHESTSCIDTLEQGAMCACRPGFKVNQKNKFTSIAGGYFFFSGVIGIVRLTVNVIVLVGFG
jgi:hypothetical protein